MLGVAGWGRVQDCGTGDEHVVCLGLRRLGLSVWGFGVGNGGVDPNKCNPHV